MRLKILHSTRYDFDEPVAYGLQQVRKTPKLMRAQKVVEWTTKFQGARREAQYDDFCRNRVELVSIEPGTQSVTIRSEGEVELTDNHGVVGAHQGLAPLWLFLRPTALTAPGMGCQNIVGSLTDADPIDRLHELSAAIRKAVIYETGQSGTHWSAEDSITAARGVCQDHTHVFLACARLMKFPARYVSGYLMMNDRVTQDAMHAWAEAHVEGLGWVGLDVSNGISPDTRYVRVATGLDYTQAAPVSGTRFGNANETLTVELEVAQQ